MSIVASPSPRVLPMPMPMTPSTSDNMPDVVVNGASPAAKRKNEDGAHNCSQLLGGLTEYEDGEEESLADRPEARPDGKENGSGKRLKTENAGGILDLAKRKVNFVQPPVSFDGSRRMKLDFEGALLDAQDAKQEITNIPEDHWKYISLAGAELTSSTEALFISHLRKALEPTDLSGTIAAAAWTALIPQLFTLEQYGVLPTDFPSSSTSLRRIPVGLQIRAWEPKKLEYFTDVQKTTLNERKEARKEARRQVEAALKAMDDVELFELAKGVAAADEGKAKEKKRIKPMTQVAATIADVPPALALPVPNLGRKNREGTAGSATGSRRSASPVKKALSAEEEEALRIKTEEKEAKRIAAEEKKAAKEEKRMQKEKEEAAREAEKQRKEAAMAKQKATMNSFFKPKVFGIPKKAIAGPSKPRETKDFDRFFKPVAMRPNVDWAPVNRFRSVDKKEAPSEEGDPVSSHLQRHSCEKRVRRAKLRTDAPYGTVGEKWDEYQSSLEPRTVLAQLKNKRRFPWKVLAFDQQTRPPYCGTFSKRSAVVGPRTPFAQDPLFDYSYDSGDDWQEEEGGDDVDDPEAEAELSDADSEDESEGEFDDWLDDEEEDEVGSVQDDEVVPMGNTREDKGGQTKLPMKQAVKRKEVKVKRVVKLAPFVKGPCWEQSIGQTDGMDVYRIQLLNDTPAGIDPFTYTSPEPAQAFKSTFTSTSVGAQLAVRTLMSTDLVGARAEAGPPSDLAASTSTPSRPSCTAAAVGSASTASTDPASAPRRALPKVLFPDSHVAELLRLIEGNTKIQSDLVSQLKAHFEGVASKAAIEVKLKEVASRQGKSKESAWRVTSEAWIAAGLAPPVAADAAATTATIGNNAAAAPVQSASQTNGDVFS